MHPTRTPVAPDVDFAALAARYEVSGGDIRNAVLKAALLAASEPDPDSVKQIHQKHLELGMDDVVAAKRVMRQSLFDEGVSGAVDAAARAPQPVGAAARLLAISVAVSGIALVLALIALTIALVR
jgi:hypothetical protein